ncbi:hypothetical protein Bache_1289 [Bacteroides helcogenes P 36-108]|uniref:Uncharacterized protein n=1 Tax=Bacteroides helcogenes (strain ATCC 35417 / DSM 20613 / JCM 6297 / CCUG 15421 / P 36-108) TaxID=693979 RepID=E6STZ6_BACT6|nr:hypothetical protein Bache_1289 [Bacteroides helcogenes P 36-108]
MENLDVLRYVGSIRLQMETSEMIPSVIHFVYFVDIQEISMCYPNLFIEEI